MKAPLVLRNDDLPGSPESIALNELLDGMKVIPQLGRGLASDRSDGASPDREI